LHQRAWRLTFEPGPCSRELEAAGSRVDAVVVAVAVVLLQQAAAPPKLLVSPWSNDARNGVAADVDGYWTLGFVSSCALSHLWK